MKIRVLCMFGGNSVEHEISILTAMMVMENLDPNRYESIPCYVSKHGQFYHGEALRQLANYQDLDLLCKRLRPVHIERRNGQPQLVRSQAWLGYSIPFDVVLPLFHGVNGEDGCAAGFCRMQQLPFCESDLLSSAIGQDKGIQKTLLREAGFLITPYAELHKEEKKEQQKEKLKMLAYPLIVKPALLGSSIGIEKVSDPDACFSALERAFAYGEHVVVEEYIEKVRELNCAVLHTPYGYRSSAVEEVCHEGDLLDYEEKYMGSSSKQTTKQQRIWLKEEDLVIEIQQMSVAIARLFEIHGVARIDYLYDVEKKQLYVNEINTIPGSLSCYLWEWEGVGFTQLLDLIIQDGIQEYRKRGKQITSYSSNVLQEAAIALGKKTA